MTPWKTIVLLARRSLWMLAGVLLFTLALVLGMRYVAGRLEVEAAQVEVAAQAQRDLLVTREEDLRNLHANIQRFQLLRQQGLVGPPERALWLEQLQASHQRLGHAGSLALQMQAPKALEGAPDAPAEGAIAAHSHDLQFEVRDILETEVLDLLDDYRTQVKGRFRVNACTLQDPKDTGLTAQCVLRFFSIADDAPKGTPTP